MSENSPFQHAGPEAPERVSIPDGTYKVNGIEEFLSNCVAADGPCFIESNGELRIMLKLRTVDGKEGPAWSGNAAEFIALVTAFGGDFTSEEISGFQLNEKNRMNSITLQLGKQSANRVANVLSVDSKNGWARGFPLMVPKGKYTVKFKGAYRKDRELNNYHFDSYPGKNGGTFEALVFEFEVVSPKLYEGLPLIAFMNNVFINPTKLKEDEKNELPDPVERKSPIMLRAYPSSVQAWENFALYFGPSFLQHQWVTKAEDSIFNVIEVYEPQFVYITCALADKKEAVVYLEPRKKGDGINFSLATIHQHNISPLDGDYVPEEVHDDAGTDQPQVLLDLITYIEKKWKDVEVFEAAKGFDTTLIFTKEGKAWAKEYLAGKDGPWEQAGLPTESPRPSLDKLTEEQLEKLFEQLKARNGELEEGW